MDRRHLIHDGLTPAARELRLASASTRAKPNTETSRELNEDNTFIAID